MHDLFFEVTLWRKKAHKWGFVCINSDVCSMQTILYFQCNHVCKIYAPKGSF